MVVAMEEPSEERAKKRLFYMGCSIAFFVIVLITGFYYALLSQKDKKSEKQQSGEIYILKDEVVDTGLIQLENEDYLQ